ncbi:MAG: BREX-2 system adenine-specific DNA-methyltransferase PglX [Pirellulaceae bacterium]
MNINSLLPELQTLVNDLAEDLLARGTEDAQIDAGLREAYGQIEKGGRTGQAFEVWREDYLDQVAVAWVLACVFVRFMEDNQLIDEVWLAGEGERRKLAEDAHELYFRAHPHESDREYFEHVFREVGKIPACRDLFAEGKTPLWAVGPSGDAAMKLLAFWREMVPETGELRRRFSVSGFQCLDPSASENPIPDPTRFLGDLYQDLSERARKKYALLQTPVFVEEFILDRTLDPAIDEFGLDEVRMIDPTCGSGHFLLGAFARLFDLWMKREDNEVVAAQKALHGVWGVDINPFAVAIARFRLIVAALQACGMNRLKSAPAWNIHLATGDSLLFGNRWIRDGEKKAEQQYFRTEDESWAPEIYACEDKDAVSEVLGQQYHAVVGNPPYITVKDKSLNQAYRARYGTCHRQYSLVVPFLERFFDLAITQSGYVGQITANSFMKREFGKKLVEEYIPRIDLTHVIDTSGAYIPGHGTPTVILFGRNRAPQEQSVRAVMGIKGEPSTPTDPAEGRVWKSIIKHVDLPDAEDEFTSAADVSRSMFYTHPWSIGGGGAASLRKKLETECSITLDSLGCQIGFLVISGEDNCLVLEDSIPPRLRLKHVKSLVRGDDLRDWILTSHLVCLWPNDDEGNPLNPKILGEHLKFCWFYRTSLKNRKAFGRPIEEKGIPWWGLRELYSDRLRTPLSIAFAFVATHNHLVLVGQ